ncbi:hypothetical protein PHET_11292, partial [Paragonimus heterotremus]
GTALSYSRRSLFISFLIGFSIGISTVAYIFLNHNAVCLEQHLTLFSLDQPQRHKELSYENTSGLPKVFCWITTMPSNLVKAVAVKRTWARRCDQYLFISSEHSSDLPSVAAVSGEGRHLLWNKTKFALTYLYKHFGDKYDYFYKADDDTYAFVDNLKRLLLERFNPETPVLIGQTHFMEYPLHAKKKIRA